MYLSLGHAVTRAAHDAVDRGHVLGREERSDTCQSVGAVESSCVHVAVRRQRAEQRNMLISAHLLKGLHVLLCFKTLDALLLHRDLRKDEQQGLT